MLKKQNKRNNTKTLLFLLFYTVIHWSHLYTVKKDQHHHIKRRKGGRHSLMVITCSTYQTPDAEDDDEEDGQRHETDCFPASGSRERRPGVVDGTGNAKPRTDGGERRQQDETAHISEKVAQIRHLRCTCYPLLNTKYASTVYRP